MGNLNMNHGGHRSSGNDAHLIPGRGSDYSFDGLSDDRNTGVQNKLRFHQPISDSNSSGNSENDQMSMNSQNINDMIKHGMTRDNRGHGRTMYRKG